MSHPYEPAATTDHSRHAVEIPGLEGRIQVSTPGLVSGSKIFADGKPVPQSWATFTLPDAAPPS